MKNTIKLKAILRIAAIQRIAALIVLATAIIIPAFARGSSDRAGTPIPVAASEPGKLTITGLDAYNGLFIQAGTHDGEIDAGSRYIEAESQMTGEMHMAMAGAVIANGSATLNVYESKSNKPYNRNGRLVFQINIWEEGGEVYYWHYAVASGEMTVTFSNGTAQGVFVATDNDE